MIDSTKPVRLLRLISDNGNPYYPGIYEPGYLPRKYLVEGIVSQDLAPAGVAPAYGSTIKTQSINFATELPAGQPQSYGTSQAPIVNVGNSPTPIDLGVDKFEVNTVSLDRLTAIFGAIAANSITEKREEKKFVNLQDLRKRVQVEGLDWDKFSERIIF